MILKNLIYINIILNNSCKNYYASINHKGDLETGPNSCGIIVSRNTEH